MTDRNPPREACNEPPSDVLRQGVELFNRRAFFEQHELLEAAWLAEPRPVRDLYRGILQIGVGFYHLERGNFRGTRNPLRYGLDRLAPLEPRCMGVEVKALRIAAACALEVVEHLGPDRLNKFDERLIVRVELAPTDEAGD